MSIPDKTQELVNCGSKKKKQQKTILKSGISTPCFFWKSKIPCLWALCKEQGPFRQRMRSLLTCAKYFVCVCKTKHPPSVPGTSEPPVEENRHESVTRTRNFQISFRSEFPKAPSRALKVLGRIFRKKEYHKSNKSLSSNRCLFCTFYHVCYLFWLLPLFLD